MRNIGAVYLKELRSYFSSSVAYISIALFLIIGGFFFYSITVVSKSASLEYSLSNLVIILIFLMPLVSMRLLSEEKKSGTLELLLTRPIKEIEIVLGKFFASATVLLAMILPTGLYGVILSLVSKPDILPMVTQYLSLYLVGLSFLALGLFASSLTENQIIAAAISFTFILIMWLLTWITGSMGPDNIIGYFAISSHFEDLNKGVVDARDIIFYLSFIVFWIYLTSKVLDTKRWI